MVSLFLFTMFVCGLYMHLFFFFSSRRRHTRCALVTGVQTCALPISAAPIARDVTLWDEYIGRFEASKAVEVRPRVSGAITAIHFTDGQIVRKGQPPFTIDPRPYRHALAAPRASAASARSGLSTEAPRVGEERVSTCRLRWSPVN